MTGTIDEKITMKIAVASQNRKEITGHTGRCRKSWIYRIENGVIAGKELLESPKEQSFRHSSPLTPFPLDNVQALIASGLVRRLQDKNIRALITQEKNPDQAVSDFLNHDALKKRPYSAAFRLSSNAADNSRPMFNR